MGSCQAVQDVGHEGPGMSESGALDRRGFLAAGAVLGTGALAGGGWVARPSAGPGPADWAALRRALSTHELSLPGERTYGRDRRLFDPRFDSLHPAGIAYCGKPADVSACLAFAVKFGLPVRAPSGGPTHAGWASLTAGRVSARAPPNHPA